MPARKPNRRSSIYLGSDGWWHGWVTIGSKDDGSPDRRHRKARTEAAVGQWMETWLTTIAPRRIRRSTLETTYAPKVRNRIIPGLGKHRLDRLTPEHSWAARAGRTPRPPSWTGSAAAARRPRAG